MQRRIMEIFRCYATAFMLLFRQYNAQQNHNTTGRKEGKLSLCVANIKHYAMKIKGGVDVVIMHVFLTSAVVRDECQFQSPTALPRGKGPRYPLYRRLGGPHNRFETRGEDKNHAPTGTPTPNPRPSSPYPVAIPTSLSRLPKSLYKNN
jgi:hypothetical protein